MPKNILRNNPFAVLVTSHFVVCFIGLIVLLVVLGGALGNHLADSLSVSVAYNAWALACLEKAKPAQLIKYIFGLFGLFTYFSILAVFLFLLTRNNLQNNKYVQFVVSKRVFALGWLGLILVVNLLVVAIADVELSAQLLAVLLWLTVFIAPFVPFIIIFPRQLPKRVATLIYITLLILISIQFLLFFLPYFQGKAFKVSNDYMDIPEQTLLQGQYVDNTQFINTHHIANLYKYDPRTKTFNNFFDKTNSLKVNYGASMVNYVKNNDSKFWLDKKTGLLMVRGQITADDTNTLLSFAASVSTQDALRAFFYNYAVNQKFYVHNYSQQEKEFIKKNAKEMTDQAIAGHYFHHQYSMLSSINEYLLGKPQSQIVFYYGWLNSVVIAKLMALTQSFSFQNYIKVLYSFYPLYFLLLILAAFCIFKDIRYVLLIALLSFGSIQAVGFEAIRLAPGFNPIRHFFDIGIILSFYWYLTSIRWRITSLLLAYLLAVIAILNNLQFGLAIYLALVATSIIHALSTDRKTLLITAVLIVASVSISVFSHFHIETGQDPTVIYSLLGVSVAPTSALAILACLFLVAVGYTLIILCWEPTNSWNWLTLLLFFYCQTLLLYYIWYFEPGHFLITLPLIAFLLAAFFKLLMDRSTILIKSEANILLVLNALIFLIFYLPTAIVYAINRFHYEEIFKNHKVYQWELPKATFLSTMDPQSFVNDVALIDQYATDKGIFIISKYDNFLPFLAGRYSAMPFPQLALSLVTFKDMQTASNAILTAHPKYIFVDTDIERNRLGDIFEPADVVTKSLEIYTLSQGRVMVLNNLARFFALIKDDYQPMAVGNLITVYQRKTA